MPSLVQHFVETVAAFAPAAAGDAAAQEQAEWTARYAERFLELLVDLLAQLPTRRFLRTLLHDHKVHERCALSPSLPQNSVSMCVETRDIHPPFREEGKKPALARGRS